MIETYGNLWTYPADFRVITTNGFVKKNGECVMGRGCAMEAKNKYPGLAKRLGKLITEDGNHLYVLADDLITFPVKHVWYEKADLELIETSMYGLWEFVRAKPGKTFVMPRAGCGNGGLDWETVRPKLERLPNSVVVITYA